MYSSPLSTPRSLTPPTSVESPGSVISSAESPGSRLLTFKAARPATSPSGSLQLATRPKTNRDSVDQKSWVNERRVSFFASERNKIRPLLADTRPFEKLIDSRIPEDAQSYKSLLSQPTGLNAVLKPYQLEGLSFLLWLRENGIGGILADDMGLGKTLQTLSLFQYIKESDDMVSASRAPFLVVCPLSVLETWIQEVAKWAPGLKAIKYHGAFDDREEIRRILAIQKGKTGLGFFSAVDVLVTTYETLMSDIRWFSRAFVWRYAVLDEGHRIKNHKSQRAQAVRKVHAEFKLVLTGTPVQNNLTELWSILHWLYPDVFVASTAELFEKAFSLNEGIFDKEFFKHVKDFLQLIMLRREKDSPGLGLDLPAKSEFVLSVPLTELQRQWYLRILTGTSQSGRDTVTTNAVSNDQQLIAMQPGSGGYVEQNPASLCKASGNLLMELRKCSIHPYLIENVNPEPYMVGPHVILNSGKFRILYRLVRQFVAKEHKKIIIFSGFDHSLDLCEDLLYMLQHIHPFKYVRLDGSTPRALRNVSIHLFQTDDRYSVFLVSIRSGGEGLNLTSSSTIIFLDEDWNPQVMKQASSRSHRIGQTKPVEIFRLQSRGTVEDQMAQRLEKKAYMASKVTESVRPELNIRTPITLANFQDLMASGQAMSMETDLDALIAHHERFRGDELDLCGIKRVTGDGPETFMSSFDEDTWLERSERVRTDIFDGQKINTSSRRFTIFKEEPLADLRREHRRLGKERTVMIDGFSVSKDSLGLSQDCIRSSAMRSSERKVDSRMAHEVTCFVCGGYNTLDCEICPRTFHEACIQAKIKRCGIRKDAVICSHHNCIRCLKGATEAGGLLFPCVGCDRAYCEQCLDWTQANFIGENQKHDAMGYRPRNAFYIQCWTCNDAEVGKRPLQGTEVQHEHFEKRVKLR